MVGGTKRPPQDSESGPWSHEQSNTKSNSNTKTFHEEESQNLSRVQVSLDNADTVIEGGPLKPSFGLSGNLPISFITSALCPASLTLFLCHARIIPDRGSEACARLQRRQALPNSRFKIRAGNKCS